MGRVDRMFVGIPIAIMLFYFYTNSKWWFFIAGICSTISFGIIMGFWLQGASCKENEQDWDTFLDSLDGDNATTKKSHDDKSAEVKKNS